MWRKKDNDYDELLDITAKVDEAAEKVKSELLALGARNFDIQTLKDVDFKGLRILMFELM